MTSYEDGMKKEQPAPLKTDPGEPNLWERGECFRDLMPRQRIFGMKELLISLIVIPNLN